MPNYLEGVPAGSEAGIYTVIDGRTGAYGTDPAGGVNPSALSATRGAGTSAASVSVDIGGFSFQGPGSKPLALHSEYAMGAAAWGAAYHGDVIFYLVRADQNGSDGEGPDSDPGGDEVGTFGIGDGGAGNSNTPGSENPGSYTVQPRAGSGVQTGPRPATAVQTAVNQVAVGSVVAQTAPMMVAPKALAGPMVGLDRNREIPANVKSHTAVVRQTMQDSINNINNVVESLDSDAIITSFPASERFFYETLLASYDPDLKLGATRTEEEIETALERGPIADFSVNLAMASGGIRTTRNLIQAINQGDVGFTSAQTIAQSERYGPLGKERRYTQ